MKGILNVLQKTHFTQHPDEISTEECTTGLMHFIMSPAQRSNLLLYNTLHFVAQHTTCRFNTQQCIAFEPSLSGNRYYYTAVDRVCTAQRKGRQEETGGKNAKLQLTTAASSFAGSSLQPDPHSPGFPFVHRMLVLPAPASITRSTPRPYHLGLGILAAWSNKGEVRHAVLLVQGSSDYSNTTTRLYRGKLNTDLKREYWGLERRLGSWSMMLF